MREDASATYRGYRRQALYVLWRLTTDEGRAGRTYVPEGAEDLAVYDGDERLVEAVQVKDHAAPLALSHLKPEQSRGFFARMRERLATDDSCQHILASFGPLGPELAAALAADGRERESIAARIHAKNADISRDEAKTLLARLSGRVTHPESDALYAAIRDSLRDTVVGAHFESAIDLLLFWIFTASELRRPLTRGAVLQQLNRIGAYLAALRDSSTEWMTTIQPLKDETPAQPDIEHLRAEYQHGVQARWVHILVGADCPRSARLAELHEKLLRHAVVVVRGASGQGKSSLVFRYLHDYSADGLRFQVRAVQDRRHALHIANALRGHVTRLALPAVVLLDLAPSDSGWVELIRDLVDAGLKVLVAIREEDLRRAGALAVDVDCAELHLESISRDEATSIYDMFIAGSTTQSPLDFEEAWARFSTTGGGPLLEFTHLVTQGTSLASRIADQVLRLQKEALQGGPGSPITSAHLRLLAHAAVATAAECPVPLADLCSLAGIDPLTRPLAALESEYLLRATDSGERILVTGLHALRSQAIEAALFHDCPVEWGTVAAACLPLLRDEDIERFLLYGFSRHAEQSRVLEGALASLPLRSWTQAGGITRALLWDGVSRYERANHEVLGRLIAEHGAGWTLACDPFIGSDSTLADSLHETLSGIAKSELAFVSLTPKSDAFLPLHRWTANAAPPRLVPGTPSDWASAGEVAYWVGTLDTEGPLRATLRALLPTPLPDIPVEELAQFISGRFSLADSAFIEWHARHAGLVAQRFVRETRAVSVVDENDEVKVYFAVPIADAVNDQTEASDLHERTMKLVRLLRQLFPQRARYGSQGLGLEHLGDLIPHDATQKRIPAENIPVERTADLNATFLNLVSYRHQRAASWQAYAAAGLAHRRAVCDCFHALQRAWGNLLEQVHLEPRAVRQIPEQQLRGLWAGTRLPLFPRTAVDEWGFVSEDRTSLPMGKGSFAGLWTAVSRLKPWQRLLRDFDVGVSQVARRALEHSHQLIVAKKEGKPITDTQTGHLLLVNLANAWTAQPDLQREFQRWFAPFVHADALAALERDESSTFRHLWAVATTAVRAPLERHPGGTRVLERASMERQRIVLGRWADELGVAMRGRGTVRIYPGPFVIDGKRSLIVACDHEALDEIETARPDVVTALWRGARAEGWGHAEWLPLTIQWQSVFVVHLVRGRALLAAGVHISSYVLFGSEAEIEVRPHHVLALPVPHEDLDAVGIRVWESPLLGAVLQLHGQLLAFRLTMLRLASIAEVALIHGVPVDDLEPSLDALSNELSVVRRAAIAAYEDTMNLLAASASGGKIAQINEWTTRLKQLCGETLIDLDRGAQLLVTSETFVGWIARAQEQAEEGEILFSSLLKFTLNQS